MSTIVAVLMWILAHLLTRLLGDMLQVLLLTRRRDTVVLDTMIAGSMQCPTATLATTMRDTWLPAEFHLGMITSSPDAGMTMPGACQRLGTMRTTTTTLTHALRLVDTLLQIRVECTVRIHESKPLATMVHAEERARQSTTRSEAREMPSGRVAMMQL